MKRAIGKGDWKEAWSLVDAVLEKHGDDADSLALVARVAHENEKPLLAAKYLVEACRKESFRKASRVQQAMIAMISTGQLHEGMELLEEAIAKQPEQFETRRWLYDFYMGTENRQAGLRHGRHLIRQRRFDLALLTTLSNTERRTQDDKPLEEMIQRNPDDLRPQLGTAKIDFDQGKFDPAIERLRAIVKAHPDYLPAQALLGRALASAEQFQEVEPWSEELGESLEPYPEYWLALGDWARGKGQTAAAARSFYEATRRDPDILESWSKLSTSLQQLNLTGQTIPKEVLDSVDQRVTLLSQFAQLKNRFERTGSISRATAIEIVETLSQIGRLWEAEAWASLAMTLPEDDSVDAKAARIAIVERMRSDTPWQLTDAPEFSIDLSNLDSPSIAVEVATPSGQASSGSGTPLRLVNQAKERGLDFFGRTSDQLQDPGIMLYQTLGCGGGAIDYDLDGWSDLYLMAAGGSPSKGDSANNALMRNVQGRFSNVTDQSGSGDTRFGQGVAVGDVNEDGFPDLLLLNYGSDQLLINNGDGTFSNQSERLGPESIHWSTSAAIADLDGDSINDIVITRYCVGLDPSLIDCPMKDSSFAQACSPMKFPGDPDLFLRSRPDGTLEDVTQKWQAQPTVIGRGLGIVAGSFDDTVGVDLLIANDMTNNHFWSRSKQGPFLLQESATIRGLAGDDKAAAQGSMGIASGDMDEDGDIDFLVTNFEAEYNTYHEQRVPGLWQDRTINVGLSRPTDPLVGFGAVSVDVDDDGTLEFLVTNGHVDIFSRADEKTGEEKRSVYAQPMQIFRRQFATGLFESIGDQFDSEYLQTPHVGRALWKTDVDNDGRVDLAVTHQTEPVAILVQEGPSKTRSLGIRLVGTSDSRDAIGATVEVTVDDQSRFAANTSGDGYLCSDERTLRFSFLTEQNECNVKVTWPNGDVQQFQAVPLGGVVVAVQGQDKTFDLKTR